MRRYSSRTASRRAFTLVEVVIVVAVLAILTTIVLVVYNGSQKRTADAVTKQTVVDALKSLQLFYIEHRNYPSNLADTGYSPPLSVAVKLFTDASQMPTYQNLTSEQNAQLFLNSCNGFMPIISGGQIYNTSCVYSGNNMHIKGQVSSNIVIGGPNITQAGFVLSCGADCAATQASIVSTFLAQGGSFPIAVPKSGSSLPSPVMVNAGRASKFCIEGRSGQFNDAVYHAMASTQSIEAGECPADASLHYP